MGGTAFLLQTLAQHAHHTTPHPSVAPPPPTHTDFHPLVDSITYSDYYLLANDFGDYLATQERVDGVYRDPAAWARMSIMSTAGSGFFSSDRTIAEVGGVLQEGARGEGGQGGRGEGSPVHVACGGAGRGAGRAGPAARSLRPCHASRMLPLLLLLKCTAAHCTACACCTAAVQQGHLEVGAVPGPHPQQRRVSAAPPPLQRQAAADAQQQRAS